MDAWAKSRNKDDWTNFIQDVDANINSGNNEEIVY